MAPLVAPLELSPSHMMAQLEKPVAVPARQLELVAHPVLVAKSVDRARLVNQQTLHPSLLLKSSSETWTLEERPITYLVR